ncbi:lipid A export permease/ATP-binding protein MsbA [Biformimicrobium ophioploci]|uniref:Lipid A export permease/ATP-binding protein MsbA n=2 Tax=Biformimicrobium ophioploci TaxID=3036711 RepID=A0ABQ6M1S9_9GAMM|nr:lipid A export permease/ATP-binding protein MsbA [Microbulbifer sp. NKW57]
MPAIQARIAGVQQFPGREAEGAPIFMDKSPVSSSPSGASTYRRLLGYARPYWAIFLVAILGFLLFSTMQVSLIAVTELLLDTVGAAGISSEEGFLSRYIAVFFEGGVIPRDTARWLIPSIMVMIAVFRGIGNFAGSYGLAYVSRSVIHDLRTELFTYIGRLPSSFYDRYTGAHLISKISYNVEQITSAITKAVKVLIRESFFTIGLLAYLLMVNWKLTLTFFLFAPIIALIVNVVGKRFRKLSHRIQNSMGDVTHVTQEAINGYQVVRMYGGQAYENKRFEQASNNNRRQFMKLVVADNASVSVIQILVSLAIAIIVWLALAPGIVEAMTPGLFASFIGAAASLAKPIRSLSEVYAEIQKGIAAAESVFDIFDEPMEKAGGDIEAGRLTGKVEIQSLTFRYESEGEPVLRDVDLKVNAGETIALVGASGSGKSTLAGLLARFYEPDAGRILVDGKDISRMPVKDYRRNISLVSQNVILFNDTVRRNIAYGELCDASDEAVENAARLAHADRFIEALPDGYRTELGDNGQLLSGGQRQRLAIARALLKDSPILILDEATSALDNESERHIQAALDEVMKGRTTFVIAHRLSTIEKADRILVMEQGAIVESGTHTELLEKGGRYAALHQQQSH